MRHKIVLGAFLAALCLLLAGCYEGLSKQDIFSLALERRDEITQAARAGDVKRLEALPGVRQVDMQEDGRVRFFCAGAGMGSGTSYYGFYYTPDDQPFDIESMTYGEALEPEGNGRAWHEKRRDPRGDNVYYTERICENLFYYESHF